MGNSPDIITLANRCSFLSLRPLLPFQFYFYSNENLALEDKSMFCHFRPRTSKSYRTIGRKSLSFLATLKMFWPFLVYKIKVFDTCAIPKRDPLVTVILLQFSVYDETKQNLSILQILESSKSHGRLQNGSF